MDQSLQQAIASILKNTGPDFYGSVTLCFQAGVVQTVKTERIEKISKRSDVDHLPINR